MRHLRLTLLGFLLVLPLGCGGKTEEEKTKSPEKTSEADTKDSQNKETAKKTPKKKTPTKNTPTENTPTENTPTNDTPTADVPPSDGSPFAMVPDESAFLLSARPAGILASEFIKAMPDQEQMQESMGEMKQQFGFDATGIASVTVALWPGDGHVVPSLPQSMMQQMQPGPPPGLNGGPGQPPKRGPEPLKKPEEPIDCTVQEADPDAQPAQPGGQPGPGGPGGPGGFGPGMIQQMLQGLMPKLDGAVFIHFTEPVDLKELQKKIPPLAALQEVSHEGKNLLVHPAIQLGGGPAVYQPNPTSLVISFKDDFAEIGKGSGNGELVSLAKAEGAEADLSLLLSLKPFQGVIGMAAMMSGQQGQGGNQIASQLTNASVFVDMNTGVDLDVVINTKTEEAVQTIKKGYDQLAQQAEGEIPNVTKNAPPGTSEETKAAAQQLAQEVYDSRKVEASGTRFHLSLRVPETAQEFIKKAAEEQKQRTQALNNLKQIGIASHNYHDRREAFPFPAGAPGGVTEEQKGKLSWRVHILPQIDQQALYEQFKLEEPWDSEHNKALLEKMPDLYKLGEGTKPGHTQLVAPEGEGFIVDGDKSRSFADLRDGASNTIIVLSVKPEQAVPWTKPGGMKIDPAKASSMLGGADGQFLALFADGRAVRLDPTIEAETLKALLTVAGGETVDRSLIWGESAPGVKLP